MRSALISKATASTSTNNPDTVAETSKRHTKKEKSPDKLAMELVQKGALKIVEADALTEQLIANNVHLAR